MGSHLNSLLCEAKGTLSFCCDTGTYVFPSREDPLSLPRGAPCRLPDSPDVVLRQRLSTVSGQFLPRCVRKRNGEGREAEPQHLALTSDGEISYTPAILA